MLKLPLSKACNLCVDHQSHKSIFCEPCIHGKQHCDPFPNSSSSQSSELLGIIHSDVHGSLPVKTFSGYHYWISFVDDYSRYVFTYPLKAKSDAFEAFKTFKALLRNSLDVSLKCFVMTRVVSMSQMSGRISCVKRASFANTPSASPQQNGVAERLNRTI